MLRASLPGLSPPLLASILALAPCQKPPGDRPARPAPVFAAAQRTAIALAWPGPIEGIRIAGDEVLPGGAVESKVEVATATVGGLRAAVEDGLRYRALDAAGHRPQLSAAASATPVDVTPPTPPSGASVEGLSETEMVLTWAPSTDDVGVTGYEVFEGVARVATVTATSATLGGLTAGSHHCWTIAARDAAGNRSAPSAKVCGNALDRTPPSTPGAVTAAPDGEHAMAVRWTRSTDNVGVFRYELRRFREGATAPELRKKIPWAIDAAGDPQGGIVSFNDAGVSAGQRYCYAVEAYDLAGNASGPSGPACATTPDLSPPSVPVVKAAPSSPTQLALAWEPSVDEVGVAGYEVRRGQAFSAKVAQPGAAEPDLAPSTEYCYTVRAFDAAGNLSAPSDPACAKTSAAGTLPGPWNLRARSGDGEIELRWSPSPQPGVVYTVSWDGRGKADARIGTTPNSSFKVFGQAAQERHCYRVVAELEEKHSPVSLPLCVGGEAKLGAR